MAIVLSPGLGGYIRGHVDCKKGPMRLDEERDWTTQSIFSLAAEWASWYPP
jgi:hypothetical protein